MVEIHFSRDFAERGVSVRLGVLVCKAKTPIGQGACAALLEQAVSQAAELLAGRKPSELEPIKKTRAAFKALGKDPSRYRPSSEALLRRIAQGKGLNSVNDIVDLNNIISLQSQLPVGNYDRAAIDGPVIFRRGRAGETYLGIGRYEINLEGLAVFADDEGPFGSPLSDSGRTKITPETKSILTVLICFDPDTDLELALDNACALIEASGVAAIESREILSAA